MRALLSFSHFISNMEVCLGSLSMWKTLLRSSFNFLADVLICCFSISITFSFLKMPSICDVHKSNLHQNSPATGCCHPQACKPPPIFLQIYNLSLWTNSFIRPQDMPSQISPHVQLQKVACPSMMVLKRLSL